MPEPHAASAGSARAARARWWSFGGDFAWAASLFLTGLGAKLGLILAHGFSLPYLDQWPGEALQTIIPSYTGKLTLAALFQPYNVHRIVPTRLIELALVRLNGQWDGLLEMSANAVVHCASVTAFGWVTASLLGKRSWPFVWLLLALELAVPFAWENAIWGFQSQFYFLLLFSWLAVWLSGLNEPWSVRWWLGAGAALAAVFSLASGFLAAAAVAVLAGVAACKRWRDWRRQLPTWILCAGLMALGLALTLSVPTDHALDARTPGEFIEALGKSLAWPWVICPWYALANCVPLCLLAWLCLSSREKPKPAVWLILGMGLWAALQALAGARVRGVGGVQPVSRYLDSLSFFAIAGALAIYVLFTEYRPRLRHIPLLRAFVVLWALAGLAGLGYLTRMDLMTSLPDIAAVQVAQLKTTRAFLATDDARVFSTASVGARPVPEVEGDVWLFRHPVVRNLLPSGARVPLRLTAARNDGGAFIPHGWLLNAADEPTEVSWGSWSAQQAAARGTFESESVKPGGLPYLEIPVAGNLGESGLSLQLVELPTGRVTEIIPHRIPGGEWLNVQVAAPAGEFKLVARDDSDTKWFAFKEPRELGRLSFWNLTFLSAWKYFLVLGLGIFALNLARSRPKPADTPALAPLPHG